MCFLYFFKSPTIKPEFPRIEDDTYIMTLGLHTSFDSALMIAINGMLDWVHQDYHISLEEATQVIGSSIEYRIPEIADPKVEVVAMIKKAVLKRLTKTTKK